MITQILFLSFETIFSLQQWLEACPVAVFLKKLHLIDIFLNGYIRNTQLC